MLRARSWIDRRMLASPGVDLRREDDSSVTHVSSLGFFNADGVPFQIQKHIRRAKQKTTTIVGFTSASHARRCDVPATRPADIPPVRVARPAAEDGHATGAVFVVFNVALIGYVSFEVAFSPNIAVGLPVVVFSADRADGGRGVGGLLKGTMKRD